MANVEFVYKLKMRLILSKNTTETCIIKKNTITMASEFSLFLIDYRDWSPGTPPKAPTFEAEEGKFVLKLLEIFQQIT